MPREAAALGGLVGQAARAAQKMPRPIRVQSDGMRQVLDHLNGTLARYDGTGETGAKALSRMLREYGQRLVIVHRGRIIVSREHARKGHEMPGLHLRMMAEAASLLPNAAYLWTADSKGCNDDRWNKGALAGACGPRKSRAYLRPCCSLPWLVMAKRLGTCECGLMMPNPYFETMHRWRVVVSTLGNRTSQRPWMERKPRLFWRGHMKRLNRTIDDSPWPSCGVAACTREDCWRAVMGSTDFGNYARLVATSLSEESPNLFDVHTSKVANRPLTADFGCAALRNTSGDGENPYFDAAARNALEILRTNPQSYIHPWVHHEAYVDYQYYLNLPGTAGGSYSRNLNTLWMLGGIVVLWSALHAEWYYPALAAGTSSHRNRIAIRSSSHRNRIAIRSASYTSIASQSPCRATWRRGHARGGLESDRRTTALRHRR